MAMTANTGALISIRKAYFRSVSIGVLSFGY
jgi:hypothetical protein